MKWKACVVLLGVFILGVGGGVVLDRVALHRYGFFPYRFEGHHRPSVAGILHRLTQELELSGAQQQDVRRILISTRTELTTMRQHMWQRVDEILQAAETRIQSVLKPEQHEAFERLIVKHRERRQQRRHHRRWQQPQGSEHDIK